MFGLSYGALKDGPVPMDLYKNRDQIKNDVFEFKQIDNEKYIVEANKEANIRYFSEYEIGKMNELLNKYSRKGVVVRTVNDDSHQIRAWKETEEDKLIDYDDMFENLPNKSREDLTPEEESYLIYKSIVKITS